MDDAPRDDDRDGVSADGSGGATRRQSRWLLEDTEAWAIVTLDADGRVETWNAGATSLLGYEREAAVGEHLSRFYEEAAGAESMPGALLEQPADGPVRETTRLRRSDGAAVRATLTVEPIREDGDLVGYGLVAGAATDLPEVSGESSRPDGPSGADGADEASALRRRRESLRRELEEVFDRIDDAFYALDDELRFTYVNDRAAELLQQPAEELLGTSVWEAYPESSESPAWDAFHEALETQEPTDYEVYFEPLEFWVEANVYPSESGLSVYFRDVTERKERERALEESEQRYRTLAEEFPNGLVMLFDEELRYSLAAGRAFERLPLGPDDLEGRRPSDVFDPEIAARIETAFRAAFDGESHTTEVRFDGRRWRLHTVPVRDDDGTVFAGMAMSQDVTEQAEMRNRLAAHNETLKSLSEIGADHERSLDEKIDGVLELGREYLGLDAGLLSTVDAADGRYEVTHAVGGLEGFEPGTVRPLSETHYRRTLDASEPVVFVDAGGEGADDGEEAATSASSLSSYIGGRVEVDGELAGTLSFASTAPREEPFTDAERTFVELAARWVSHELSRAAHRRELEEYRTLTAAARDVIVTIDGDSTIRSINPAVEDLFGYEPDELVGEPLTTLMPEELQPAHRAGVERFLASGDRSLDWEYLELPGRRADGSHVPLAISFSSVERDGEHYFTGIMRDITERREYERELDHRRRQQSVVADLGQLALETDDIDDLAAEASRLVARTLETAAASVLELKDGAGGREQRLVQGHGWPDDAVGSATVADDPATLTGRALRSEEPVVLGDAEREARLDGPGLPDDRDVASGAATLVGSVDDPWGVLAVHDDDPGEFTAEDVDFLQSVATVLTTAIEREQRERQLAQQRERLAALNSLHEVIGDITEAVIEQSTREEIEEIVCERLAAAESYRFAWIGDVDATTRLVEPRSSAGAEEYLETVEISIDPDDPRSRGPTGRAVAEGETHVVADVRDDPNYEPWQQAAGEHGFRSSAAIPIVHDDTVYGVLNVYADRRAAFEAEERRIVTQLGEIVGHAIAAVERKRALTSDQVLEVELRVPDVMSRYDVSQLAGRIEFDRLVPTADDEFRAYATAHPDDRKALESLFEAVPYWRDGQVTGETESSMSFEVRLEQSPLHGTIASHSGVVVSAGVEHGDLGVTAQLPSGTDVRQVITDLQEEYPDVEMLARRQVERSPETVREVLETFSEELTERQRIALETAVHGGYFEWPRESTGEEIADQLDIAAATFTQHLRAAERKLFEALFAELPTSA